MLCAVLRCTAHGPRYCKSVLDEAGKVVKHGFYPETGAVEDCGVGPGVGYNVNIPWTEAKKGEQRRYAWQRTQQRTPRLIE